MSNGKLAYGRSPAPGGRKGFCEHIKEGVIVEKQSISLFRQKNKWGLTILSVVLFVMASPLLMLSLATPQLLMLLPVALLWLLGAAGTVSAAICTAVFAALCGVLFGGWGVVHACIFLVPTLVISTLLVERKIPFWESAAASCAAMFISIGVALGMMTMLAGSDVVSAISELMRQAFEGAGKLGDSVLVMLAQMGLLEAPDNLTYLESSGMLALNDANRSSLLGQLVMLMDTMLRLEIPMQMATGSVMAGVVGQAVLRRGLASRGITVDAPPIYTWRVPDGWGRVLGGTLVLLFALSKLVGGSALSMYYVFGGVFERVYALQGVAAVCYMLDQRGKGRGWKLLVFALGMTLLSSAAIVVGIADQAMDITKRREALGSTGLEITFGRGEEK